MIIDYFSLLDAQYWRQYGNKNKTVSRFKSTWNKIN